MHRRDCIANEGRFRSIVTDTLRVGGVVYDLSVAKTRIDELETKINDLEKLIHKQQKIIDALWYNPGPGGPGAAEASESFHANLASS